MTTPSQKKAPLSEGTVDPDYISFNENTKNEGSISTVDAVVLQKDSAEAEEERSL